MTEWLTINQFAKANGFTTQYVYKIKREYEKGRDVPFAFKQEEVSKMWLVKKA